MYFLNFSSQLRNFILAAILQAIAVGAIASSFGVVPLKVELGGAVRSAIVTVTNDSLEPLLFNVSAVTWSMTDTGEEVYEPTEDLAFYPKALSIPAGEKRVVRVGYDSSALRTTEKTYRLFLRETQDERTRTHKGAQVAMLVNFGVAIFVPAPAGKAALAGEVQAVTAGQVSLQLKNSGEVHARIDTLKFRAQEPKAFGSAYILAGRDRRLTMGISAQDCARGLQQVIELSAGEQTLAIPVDLTMACENHRSQSPR